MVAISDLSFAELAQLALDVWQPPLASDVKVRVESQRSGKPGQDESGDAVTQISSSLDHKDWCDEQIWP